MGWNKRSSGNRYDSNSGHAFIIGGITKKYWHARVFKNMSHLPIQSKAKHF